MPQEPRIFRVLERGKWLYTSALYGAVAILVIAMERAAYGGVPFWAIALMAALGLMLVAIGFLLTGIFSLVMAIYRAGLRPDQE